MATFDQLPADQRAIIELVLKRGRTYDALSDMLDMPTARVRELAHDALVELAPKSAGRVDPDWRDQVADYALGQQSGPDSAATEGHLRRSEQARAWLSSLIDSLDHLYADGSAPEIPEAEAPGRSRERGRDRERARDRKERDRDGDRDKGAAATTRKERASSAKREDEDEKRTSTKARPSALSGGREGGPLSPAARAAVQRRRLIGGAIALVVVVLAVLLLTGVIGGDDSKDSSPEASKPTSTAANGGEQPQLIGQLQLEPTARGEKDTVGVAAVAKTGDKLQLALQAKLPPSGDNEAYEVWLYNTKDDAVSIGAQRTDAEGNYEGAGEIPADYAKYKFIDVSLEKIDRNAKHSGKSVLRGEIAKLQAPQQQQQQPGGGAAPQQPGAGQQQPQP